MTPGQLILPTIWRGRTWLPTVFTWKDANGNPFDLTNWTPNAQTRSGNSLNALVTDAAAGQTILQMPFAQTTDMKLGVEQWDWNWTFNAGLPGEIRYPPILTGTVLVDQPTSRET